MGREEIGAYVHFASRTVKVRETPEEVERAIVEIGPMHVPLVRLTRASGSPVTVNAATIETISGPKGRGEFP